MMATIIVVENLSTIAEPTYLADFWGAYIWPSRKDGKDGVTVTASSSSWSRAFPKDATCFWMVAWLGGVLQ
jgi:hypothetical protein